MIRWIAHAFGAFEKVHVVYPFFLQPLTILTCHLHSWLVEIRVNPFGLNMVACGLLLGWLKNGHPERPLRRDTFQEENLLVALKCTITF